jgi:hypothetical protein
MTRCIATCLAVLALLLTGSLGACGDAESPVGHDHDSDHDHGAAHAHVAPHGGDLVVCREEFAHVEVVLDAASGTLSMYLLGAHGEKPVRSTAKQLAARVQVGEDTFELTLDAVANDLSGESVGDTSLFQGTDPRLVGAEHVEGTLLSAELRGETFTDLPFHVPVH